jgi:hypothetical protein
MGFFLSCRSHEVFPGKTSDELNILIACGGWMISAWLINPGLALNCCLFPHMAVNIARVE